MTPYFLGIKFHRPFLCILLFPPLLQGRDLNWFITLEKKTGCILPELYFFKKWKGGMLISLFSDDILF